jgi:Protein of unknown function (DUF2852)
MTYESRTSGQTAGSANPSWDNAMHRGRDYFWWARTPGFHPMKLLTVLVGFAIFPPLGIAALIYFLWTGRRGWNERHGGAYGMGRCGRRRGRTGNAAFDEHQKKILAELEEERRAFREHRETERRKRDQEAYDAFRAAKTASATKPADGNS